MSVLINHEQHTSTFLPWSSFSIFFSVTPTWTRGFCVKKIFFHFENEGRNFLSSQRALYLWAFSVNPHQSKALYILPSSCAVKVLDILFTRESTEHENMFLMHTVWTSGLQWSGMWWTSDARVHLGCSVRQTACIMSLYKPMSENNYVTAGSRYMTAQCVRVKHVETLWWGGNKRLQSSSTSE